jgi:hypothetical protein
MKINSTGSKAKAAIFAGVMALALTPAMAFAEPQGQMMGAEMPPVGMEQSSEQQGQAPQQVPQQGQAPMQMQQNASNQAPEQMQHNDATAPSAQPSQQGQQTQQAPQGQPGQQNQMAQEGQQNQQGQAPAQNASGDQMPPEQMGEMAPLGDMPAQDGMHETESEQKARESIKKLTAILGVEIDEDKVNEILDVMRPHLGLKRYDKLGEFGGQPGRQPNQAGGQMSGQPGGQPNQVDAQHPGTQQPGQPGGMNDNAPSSYDSANIPTEDAAGNSYNSTAANQNAVLVDGQTLSLTNVSVNKTGDATAEDADFYGINAAILANNGATLTIDGSDVSTNGAHANGVFSYGTGTTVNISNFTINTTGNNSGGLMTTGRAALNATNLTVTTSGNSSAAIRTDRGGGTVSATQGSYSTRGVGSPAIYSTADVTVRDATLSSTKSEAVVIEGGNSVTLLNSSVTGNNSTLNGQSTVKTNVLIYQSMSGDASEGESSFTMDGGTLTSLTGSMFHVTNTTTTINLTGVTIKGASDSNDLLIASADAWGTSGKNGGHATVNLTDQVVSGNITVDSVSSVALNLSNSDYTGAISNKGTVSVHLGSGCTWTLTGDSSVSSLTGDLSGIDLNGHTLLVNGVAYTG